MAGGADTFSTLKEALHTFQIDNGRYPTTDEGLNALVTCPPGFSNYWHGPYIESVPLDEWGTPFKYECVSSEPYQLRSAGPDRIFDTEDDITEAPEW